MLTIPGLDPIELLIIGHFTKDITPQGPVLGGTAAYSARTAQALGLRVGVVTAWAEDVDHSLLDLPDLTVVNDSSDQTTTFENLETAKGRVQTVQPIAPSLDYYHVPQLWREAPYVHIAPVLHEVNPAIARNFPDAEILLTPQGWLRQWSSKGEVDCAEWPEARYILRQVTAAGIREEDVRGNLEVIKDLAEAAPILVVTLGENGAMLYQDGDEILVDAPETKSVDTTGAGDIFATAFFVRYCQTQDAREAVQFANQVAADSITRPGLAGAPSKKDISNLIIEVE